MMTFEEFQATGRECSDLGETLQDAMWEDYAAPARGRIYLDCLWIEEKPVAGWPNGSNARWYLILGRDDWLTDNLEELERELYDFAIDERFI